MTVVLGTNGTGKSTLLRELAQGDRRSNGALAQTEASLNRVTFVEGGRVANVPERLVLERSGDRFDSPDEWDSGVKMAKRQPVRKRSRKVFDALRRKTSALREQHSQAVSRAQEASQPIPEIDETPMEKTIRLFCEIFPSLRLEVDSEEDRLWVHKHGGAKYSPDGLSDGERQVLMLLADLAVHGAGEAVVVDEPELNLNSGLAVRVWETIEEEVFSESGSTYFVYATHSLGFASRASVDRVYVLSNQTEVATRVDSPRRLLGKGNISPEGYLGALTSIVATPKALVTEGKDESIDRTFYSWVLGEEWKWEKGGVTVAPLEGGSDVKAAVKQEGVWDHLPETRLVGATDRDYMSDSQVENGSHERLVVLDYHEVESYLLYRQA